MEGFNINKVTRLMSDQFDIILHLINKNNDHVVNGSLNSKDVEAVIVQYCAFVGYLIDLYAKSDRDKFVEAAHGVANALINQWDRVHESDSSVND